MSIGFILYFVTPRAAYGRAAIALQIPENYQTSNIICALWFNRFLVSEVMYFL